MCLWWQPHRGRRSRQPEAGHQHKPAVVESPQVWSVLSRIKDWRTVDKGGICVRVRNSVCEVMFWVCVFCLGRAGGVCGDLPSPALEAPTSKSSRVPLCVLRYVAGTQPCSSAVLTNHQPVEKHRWWGWLQVGHKMGYKARCAQGAK